MLVNALKELYVRNSFQIIIKWIKKNVGSCSLSGNLESGGGDTLHYSNLKVIAVPVLATILHTPPLTNLNK